MSLLLVLIQIIPGFHVLIKEARTITEIKDWFSELIYAIVESSEEPSKKIMSLLYVTFMAVIGCDLFFFFIFQVLFIVSKAV